MNLNIDMNMLRELDGLSVDETDARRRMAQYLYRLTEELRYVIDNLEPENFSAELLEKWNGMVMDLDERVLKLDPGDEYTVTADNKSMAALQAWVDGHGKMLTRPLTINIKAEMDGDLTLRGFKDLSGDGKVIVKFLNDGRLHGSISAFSCDRVEIAGRGNAMSPDIQPDTGTRGVRAFGVKYLKLTDLVVNLKESSASATAKYVISAEDGTKLYATGCNVLGGYIGFFINMCSDALIYECVGGQGTGSYGLDRAVHIQSGCHVWVTTTKKPKGSYVSATGCTLDVYSGAAETAGIADNAVIPY